MTELQSQQLRPVEVLYIFSRKGEESFGPRQKFISVMAYLEQKGVIETKKKDMTVKVKKKDSISLRRYEREALEALENDDVLSACNIINHFDFKQLMRDNGFAVPKEEKSMFGFGGPKVSYQPSQKFEDVLQKYRGFQSRIRNKANIGEYLSSEEERFASCVFISQRMYQERIELLFDTHCAHKFERKENQQSQGGLLGGGGDIMNQDLSGTGGQAISGLKSMFGGGKGGNKGGDL